jgi:hypothetical protein
MLRLVMLVVGLVALVNGSVQSETYYVAPPDTKLNGVPNGSESLPFLSLGSAFSSGRVKGGDTLLLKDGAYGSVTIKANAAFDAPVEIVSQNGKSAHFDNILLAGNTRNLTLRNLSVWPRDPANGSLHLIRAYNSTSHITVDGLDIRSDEGAADYMNWTAERWNARKFSGILLEGPNGRVTSSKLTGIYHGIMVGDYSQIMGNSVSGFNGDGMRAGSNSLVMSNRVVDCVKTDGNHDDGFQALYALNLVLDSNTIIEWTGDYGNALRCSLQGVGYFSGEYQNIVIQNNLVVVSAYHGISVYGANGVRILNNTVAHAGGHTVTHPYIFVSPSKEGVPSTDALVANNVAMSIRGTESLTDRVHFRNNSVIGKPSVVFENPFAYDYRPKATSGFIDSGDINDAPAKDLLGNPRPSGASPDRGAIEIQVGAATPPPSSVKPVTEPVQVAQPTPVTEPVQVTQPTPVTDSGQVAQPAPTTEPVQVVQPTPTVPAMKPSVPAAQVNVPRQPPVAGVSSRPAAPGDRARTASKRAASVFSRLIGWMAGVRLAAR